MIICLFIFLLLIIIIIILAIYGLHGLQYTPRLCMVQGGWCRCISLHGYRNLTDNLKMDAYFTLMQ